MSTITTEAISLHEIVAEIYEHGHSSRELAEMAFDAATDEANREAAIQGWESKVRAYEANWNRTRTRSGHQNASGRMSGTRYLAGRGILSTPVRTNDGICYQLADVTAAVAAQFEDEYRARKRQNAAGEKFYRRLREELKPDQTVADLGEERVEQLAVETGWRRV